MYKYKYNCWTKGKVEFHVELLQVHVFWWLFLKVCSVSFLASYQKVYDFLSDYITDNKSIMIVAQYDVYFN